MCERTVLVTARLPFRKNKNPASKRYVLMQNHNLYIYVIDIKYFCILYIFINVYIYCSYTHAYMCISACPHVGARKLISATVCFKAFQCMAARSWSGIPLLALAYSLCCSVILMKMYGPAQSTLSMARVCGAPPYTQTHRCVWSYSDLYRPWKLCAKKLPRTVQCVCNRQVTNCRLMQ